MSLAGKKVVVVGGSSGIGLSTAEMAKREGAAGFGSHGLLLASCLVRPAQITSAPPSM